MPKWSYAVAALFAVYFPLAVWLDRSYVSKAPKGRIVIQMLMPFERYNHASIPRRDFIKRLNEFGDDPKKEGDNRSPLVIYEDGKPLGPGHNTFADIYHLGAGRFSHLNDGIIFSTSDNSDPNANGKKYWAVVP
jgi:hypothetical protein